jgi:sulfur-carrier protein
MKVVYFAWLRERIQRPEEEIDFPSGVVTVADALAHLVTLGEEYAYAFEKPEIIRAALDKKHVKPETPIAGAREIAFFPPMTGG